ncbi:MAG: hypothetical protein CM15mV104_060 [Caudoviricetes sp.]|nr:MAG: hypothetical protein CM15mV104_060 [Caudoviricetes sp.]
MTKKEQVFELFKTTSNFKYEVGKSHCLCGKEGEIQLRLENSGKRENTFGKGLYGKKDQICEKSGCNK